MQLAETFQSWAWQNVLAARGLYQSDKYTGINAVDWFGRTRLMRAAEQSDNAAIAQYLAQGANPNLEAIYANADDGSRIRYAGTNALIEAITKDNIEGVRLLLDGKANPNLCVLYTDPGMGTYSIYPADRIRSDSMRTLLSERGADMTRQGDLARMAADRAQTTQRRRAGRRPPV